MLRTTTEIYNVGYKRNYTSSWEMYVGYYAFPETLVFRHKQLGSLIKGILKCNLNIRII